MFETATLSPGPASKRFWSTCAGLAGEALLLGCAVLVPVLSPQVLPRAMFATMLAAPGVPPPPPAPGPVVRPTRSHPAPRLWLPVTEPARVPTSTPTIIDLATDSGTTGVSGGVEGGVETGIPGALVLGIAMAGTAPAPPPPRVANTVPVAAPPAIPRYRAGGIVSFAEPIFRPEPQYPALARQMRISGTVELEGVIGTDGHLRELRIVSGHPLLARAALQAVSQWIYKPTRLNGDPVEVIAPITVTFHLN